MPKYQIILQSDKIIPDDEFKVLVLNELENEEAIGLGLSGFVLIDARNLEGIRHELWDFKEMIKMEPNEQQLDKAVDTAFRGIEKLFSFD